MAVRDQMSSLPFATRIHFEMASFTDTELLNDLMDYVVPYADSLGMNEQVRLYDSGSCYREGRLDPFSFKFDVGD